MSHNHHAQNNQSKISASSVKEVESPIKNDKIEGVVPEPIAPSEEVAGASETPVETTETLGAPVEESTAIPEQPAEKTPVFGVVSNCAKLNIRSTPEGGDSNNVIGTVDVSVTIEVDLDSSTEDFFKIRTLQGLEGFCMKNYVTLS